MRQHCSGRRSKLKLYTLISIPHLYEHAWNAATGPIQHSAVWQPSSEAIVRRRRHKGLGHQVSGTSVSYGNVQLDNKGNNVRLGLFPRPRRERTGRFQGSHHKLCLTRRNHVLVVCYQGRIHKCRGKSVVRERDKREAVGIPSARLVVPAPPGHTARVGVASRRRDQRREQGRPVRDNGRSLPH
jgi:hypothetical protein